MGQSSEQSWRLLSTLCGEAMLAQMLTGKHEAAIHKPAESGKYIHFDTLWRYFQCDSIPERESLARCLHHLVAARAPTDNRIACAGRMFAYGSWDPTDRTTDNLSRAYIAAGFIDPTKPIHGESTDVGKLPLAAAISWLNTGYVRALIESGASWNLGPDSNGAERDALEYAISAGATSVASTLSEIKTEIAMRANSGSLETLMRDRIEASGSIRIGELPAAHRRRMGI